MRVHVLGSGAGGGYPQWNCNCEMCAAVRRGEPGMRRRTQSSISVTLNGRDWLLINASPDIRAQLEACPPLQPARGLRDTGVRAILLMDSQIDHTTGLLSLRESAEPLRIYCTDMVHQDLTQGFPLFRMLEHYCGVDWRQIDLSSAHFPIPEVTGLEVEVVPLSSKAPPYSPHRHDPHPGDNIGITLIDTATDKRVFYAPGLGKLEPHLHPVMERADCLLVDGTFWSDDEMLLRGVGSKRAADMGHLPQSGEHGMIECLRGYAGRKILIHINNTNRILRESAPERETLRAHGIEVACDGMDIRL